MCEIGEEEGIDEWKYWVRAVVACTVGDLEALLEAVHG